MYKLNINNDCIISYHFPFWIFKGFIYNSAFKIKGKIVVLYENYIFYLNITHILTNYAKFFPPLLKGSITH